jgi:hypothetical protein
MKKTLSQISMALIISTLALHALSAQIPVIKQFSLSYGGDTKGISRMGNFRPTADGGYIAAATRYNGEYSRALILKMNANFQMQWSLILNMTLTGGNSWQASFGADVLELGNSRYALLATINNFPLSNDASLQNADYAFIRLEKTNSGATIESAQCFGGDFADVAHSMERTQDNGFILSGYSNEEQALNVPTRADTYLVKLSANGALQWQKRYRNTAAECFTTGFVFLPDYLRRPVVATSDGGFLFGFTCDEFNYFAKVDANGNELWTKRFTSNGAIGEAFQNVGGGELNLGATAGTGGAIVAIRELPNGDLAFLGNQFSYFLVLWGISLNENGGAGIALPVSYLFTTDAAGNYKNGLVFFRDRFNDQQMPIEMQGHDFQVLDNGHFVVACGLNQFVFSTRPGLAELDIEQSALDQGVVRLATATSEEPHLTSYAYPAGGGPMRLLKTASNGGVLTYGGSQILTFNDFSALGGLPDCLRSETGLRSFGLEFPLEEVDLFATSLSTQPLVLQLTNGDASSAQTCGGTIGTDDLSAAASGLRVSHSAGRFTLHSTDEAQWLGSRYALLDATGRLRQAGVLASPTFEAAGLAAGIYFVQIEKDDARAALKVIVVD